MEINYTGVSGSARLRHDENASIEEALQWFLDRPFSSQQMYAWYRFESSPYVPYTRLADYVKVGPHSDWKITKEYDLLEQDPPLDITYYLSSRKT